MLAAEFIRTLQLSGAFITSIPVCCSTLVDTFGIASFEYTVNVTPLTVNCLEKSYEVSSLGFVPGLLGSILSPLPGFPSLPSGRIFVTTSFAPFTILVVPFT